MAKESIKEIIRKPEKSNFTAAEDALGAPEGVEQKIAWMLRQFRAKAGLSQAQLIQKTKIHHRILESLENGEFKKMPSPAHLRAFILAVTRACDGDEKAILELWRESNLSGKL